MRLEVSLAPDGALRVHLPSGRFLDIPTRATERIDCTECGEAFRASRPSVALQSLTRILRESEVTEPKRGYIGSFPTQEIVNTWAREFKERDVATEKKKLSEKFGVDLDKVEISL